MDWRNISHHHIQPVAAQVAHGILGQQPQLHPRMCGAKGGQARQDPEMAEGKRGAQRDGIALKRLADGVDHLGHAGEGLPHRARKRRALRSEDNTAIGAQEQGHIQISFQQADLTTDRRLCHAQLCRGLRETAQTRRRLKGGQRAHRGDAAAQGGHGRLRL